MNRESRKSVSARWLKSRGACAEQVETVLEEWGKEEIPLTRENLLRAAELNLSLQWLAEAVLDNEALAEYERQRAPIWAECDRQSVDIWAEYWRQRAEDEYERQRAHIRVEYGRQLAEILASILEVA